MDDSEGCVVEVCEARGDEVVRGTTVDDSGGGSVLEVGTEGEVDVCGLVLRAISILIEKKN